MTKGGSIVIAEVMVIEALISIAAALAHGATLNISDALGLLSACTMSAIVFVGRKRLQLLLLPFPVPLKECHHS